MKKTKLSKQPKYMHTWTYHAIIALSNLGYYIFNHGTESDIKMRTAKHTNECRAQGLVYEVIEEKMDRLFGSEVIAPAYDKEFAKRVAKRLNETVLAGSPIKAISLAEWLESNKNSKEYYNVRLANLSETECCVVPDCVTIEQLKAAIIYVETSWYHVDTSLRVLGILKDKEYVKSIPVKPIPVSYINAMVVAVKTTDGIVIVQGLKAACIEEAVEQPQAMTIITTVDDIQKNKEEYTYLRGNSNYTIIQTKSNKEMVEEYYKMTNQASKAIINPPYDGNLHLSVIKHTLQITTDNGVVVNLSPIKPLYDYFLLGTPLPEELEFIVKHYNVHITKVVNANEAKVVFGVTAMPSDLGIWKITKEASTDLNELKTELFDALTLSVKDKVDNTFAACRRLDEVLEKTFSDAVLNLKFLKNVILGSHGETAASSYCITSNNYETAKEKAKESASGQSHNSYWYFTSEEERANAHKFYSLPLMRYYYRHCLKGTAKYDSYVADVSNVVWADGSVGFSKEITADLLNKTLGITDSEYAAVLEDMKGLIK